MVMGIRARIQRGESRNTDRHQKLNRNTSSTDIITSKRSENRGRHTLAVVRRQ